MELMTDVNRFFDRLYFETYRPFETEDRNEAEARFIIEALEINPPARVLDVGCGYARHAVYIAKHGFEVTCIDKSEYLLGKAIERIREYGVEDRIEILRVDMRWLGLPPDYDAAYIFYTTFGYFDDEENFSVLRGISSALKPGGRLLIDVWNPFRLISRLYNEGGRSRNWYEAGGYTILEETWLENEKPILHLLRKFIDSEGRMIDVKSINIRFYFPWEYREMFEKVGLKIHKLYGDYRKNPFKLDSPRMIIIGLKEV